jgi:hypothetical protein
MDIITPPRGPLLGFSGVELQLPTQSQSLNPASYKQTSWMLLLLLLLHAGRPYQTELLGPLMDMITVGSTVVDVGGNLGSFTAFFAAATGLQGRVYSFEPQNKMFQVRFAGRRQRGGDSVCCSPL